ncbi:hypothetical protein C2E20_2702 [Micractinium conductrix]|uniref:Uncharacterized protein n=1 Tax=Micractinium conductrix TaxID=554055 RepID=A0A2P6VJH0_9CHLO|nr:hypothetical protein C2E20_2702 [Micractinium conductrix]|eukprot:PSC74245.1 hypothetical protein C2E20_2702 [Micractinium conductrix]
MLWSWSNSTLVDCGTLNLPCADVRPFMLEPLGKGRDMHAVMWMKPFLVLHALRAGYLTMLSSGVGGYTEATRRADSDVSFTSKPLWDVLSQLAVRSYADAVFQEESPVNSRCLKMWRRPSLTKMQKQINVCRHAGDCLEQRQLNGTKVRWRTFQRWNAAYHPDDCRVNLDWNASAVDACDASVLFIHPLCIGWNNKAGIMKRADMWFLDTENCGQVNGSHVPGMPPTVLPVCPPRQWRLPDTESRIRNCGRRTLEQLLAYLGARWFNCTAEPDTCKLYAV